MLHDIEYLATLASIQGQKGYRYPKRDIDEMWENVLLCQFHDCLPGSAIAMCYDDSDKVGIVHRPRAIWIADDRSAMKRYLGLVKNCTRTL